MLASATVVVGQERIDGTFAFGGDPAKQYSLYIPSSYSPVVPNRLMIGLHPLNVNRWDSVSWCDTLIVFAETHGLLMACPDGGPDGRVDDPIDQGFTDALYDSMLAWYNVDTEKTYAMGFSWGGRATYEYGLSRIDKIHGLVPIGAAINGTAQVDSVLHNAQDMPVYIVHGSADSPGTRFYPVRDALIANGAIVEWNLMSGVGHTIDFPNRNAILGTAYAWVDSVNCVSTAGVGDQGAVPVVSPALVARPNPFSVRTHFTLGGPAVATGALRIYDVRGHLVAEPPLPHGRALHWDGRTREGRLAPSGVYLAALAVEGNVRSAKVVFQR